MPKLKKHAVRRLGVAVSMKAASAMTGLSAEVLTLAKASGCQAFKERGSVNLDELLEWVAANSSKMEGAGVIVERKSEELLRLRADRLTREFRLAVLRKEYVPAVDVETSVAEMIGNAKKKLLSGPSAIAPQIVGGSVPEAETMLKEWLREALSQP